MRIANMSHIAIGLLLFVNMAVVFQLPAQKNLLTRKEQKAILKKADIDCVKFNYTAAAAKYEIYLHTVPGDFNVLMSLADCYWQSKDFSNTFRIYKRVFPHGNNGATKVEQLRIAEMYAREHSYKLASEWLDGLDVYQAKADAYADESMLKYMKKDSLNWRTGFLNINTSYQEFSPFIVDDDLIFSSDRPNRNKANAFKGAEINYDRVWTANLSKVRSFTVLPSDSNRNKKLITRYGKNIDAESYVENEPHTSLQHYERGETSTAVDLIKGLNKTKYNVGAVSVDKNKHFYFTTNYTDPDKKGINRLRLVEAISRKHSFKRKILPFGNPRFCSVMHSAINRDGTLMVFSSERTNGRGRYDLYSVRREHPDKAWGEMKELGGNVNTAGNEVFPSITTDGYLYFSSDALPGLGGLDIFRIPLQDALDGKGGPEHISYPINSSGDDFGWTQDTINVNGYFTSDRLNHNNDLYSFRYKEPVKMSYFDNEVCNSETMEPIEGATLFLYNKADGKVYIAKTDKQGKYRFKIPNAEGVIVKAVVKGFSSYCIPAKAVSISQPNDTVLKASTTFSQEKLKINFAWKLDNIYYAFAKSYLKVNEIPVLDSLISILNKYPISVEICSFTDSRGSDAYNYQLSLRRSESVVNYLVTHGINSSRLIAKAYGESKLLNRCADGVTCTEEEHKVNRRTEVKVIDYDVDQKSAKQDLNIEQFSDGDVVNKKALPVDFFKECDTNTAP